MNELKLLLSSLNLNLDIICIPESRITKSDVTTSNIDVTTRNIHIPGYNIEQTPTESSAGGSLIYLSRTFLTETDPNSKYTTLNHLESAFIEILLPDKSSCIVGTVYKHPTMKPYSFNTSSSQLFQKIKNENKKTIITGDFNPWNS